MSEVKSSSVVEQGVNGFFATFERAQHTVSIDNVYGEPIKHGEALVVPIASASQLFGVGGGLGNGAQADNPGNEGAGGGGGGAIRTRPIAVAEIDEKGVKIHPVVDENRALAVSLAFAAWTVFWTARTLSSIFKPTTR